MTGYIIGSTYFVCARGTHFWAMAPALCDGARCHPQALPPPRGQSTPWWDLVPSSLPARFSFHWLLWPKRVEKFLKSRSIKVLARAEVLMVNIEVFLHIKPVFSGVWMTKEDGALHGLNFLVASKQILPKTQLWWPYSISRQADLFSI